jgi:hypothetical protein
MATPKQIAANRRNAAISTGPKTGSGKRRSRQNAWRHGLTAETIVSVAENAADYEIFEARIVSDYKPQTAVETALVTRLASLLWRLRRATAIESGLLQIQAKTLQARTRPLSSAIAPAKDQLRVFYNLIPSLSPPTQTDCEQLFDSDDTGQTRRTGKLSIGCLEVTKAFLRLAERNSGTFEMLGRYEMRLWRQLAQTVYLIGQVAKLNREPAFLGGEFIGSVRRNRR